MQSRGDLDAAKAIRDTALDLGQNPLSIDLAGPYMFSEDFAFMLEEVPGAYFGIGNGPSKNLHESSYDFNDELLVRGTQFWAALVQRQLRV